MSQKNTQDADGMSIEGGDEDYSMCLTFSCFACLYQFILTKYNTDYGLF